MPDNHHLIAHLDQVVGDCTSIIAIVGKYSPIDHRCCQATLAKIGDILDRCYDLKLAIFTEMTATTANDPDHLHSLTTNG